MDWKYFASALPHQTNAAPSGIKKNARRGFFSQALTIDPDNFFVPLMTQLLKVSTKKLSSHHQRVRRQCQATQKRPGTARQTHPVVGTISRGFPGGHAA